MKSSFNKLDNISENIIQESNCIINYFNDISIGTYNNNNIGTNSENYNNTLKINQFSKVSSLNKLKSSNISMCSFNSDDIFHHENEYSFDLPAFEDFRNPTNIELLNSNSLNFIDEETTKIIERLKNEEVNLNNFTIKVNHQKESFYKIMKSKMDLSLNEIANQTTDSIGNIKYVNDDLNDIFHYENKFNKKYFKNH